MFLKLRGKMKELDIDQAYLAKKIGLCEVSISLRMNRKREWTLTEIYAVMDLIHEPYERLSEFFPKDGVAVSKKTRLA